jgi:cholesterol transport system auxiliary component
MRRGIWIVAALLAGCAGTGADTAPRQYDLGLAAPAAKLPPLRSVSVRAAMPFDGVDMHYRLAYRDAAELASFAHSRWAAPPAELMRKQLHRALPAGSGAPCVLELEIQEFTQVFTAKDASEARIEVRAAAGGATRAISVTEAGAGANAAAGAAAFTRAADRAIAELGGWVAAQRACAGS